MQPTKRSADQVHCAQPIGPEQRRSRSSCPPLGRSVLTRNFFFGLGTSGAPDLTWVAFEMQFVVASVVAFELASVVASCAAFELASEAAFVLLSKAASVALFKVSFDIVGHSVRNVVADRVGHSVSHSVERNVSVLVSDFAFRIVFGLAQMWLDQCPSLCRSMQIDFWYKFCLSS